MTTKTRKIIATVFIGLTSLALVMSGFFKLAGGEMIVENLTKAGFGDYIPFLGIAELVFVALFLIPRTYKIGFYLILSYLGGAAAIDIATGQPPVPFLLLIFAWIGFYLKDPGNFWGTVNK